MTRIMKTKTYGAICAAFALSVSVLPLEAAQAGFAPDKNTDLLIGVKGGKVVDLSGRVATEKIRATGVEIVPDARFGEVMRFTGDKRGGIVVPDEGKIGFGRGFTVEGWIFLEREVTNDMSFACKYGKDWQKWSFSTSLEKDSRFGVGLLGFEGEPIDFTEDEKKHQWGFRPDKGYGGRGGCSHGHTRIPVGEWVHVAYSYDASRSLHRLWVNGSVDREFFRRHTLTRKVCDEDDAPVRLFSKADGIKVAQVRLSPMARDLGVTAPVRVFIHENAWRDEGYVHVQPVRDDLPVPVEIEVMNVHIPFFTLAERATLSSATAPINVPIPKCKFPCLKSTLVVKVRKDGREIWRHETFIRNPKPETGGMSKFYSGKGPWDGRERPDWRIEADNTFTYKKQPIFPLMIYAGRPDCFDELADIGFNMISMRPPKGVKKWEWPAMKEPFFARAAEKGVTLTADGDVPGRPAQGFDFLMDEPYDYTFETFRDRFMDARNGRRHATTLPLVATQNNQTRYRETSMACDILAPDPYTKGREPMRGIYDAIRAACEDVDHLKPVMCIVGNYGTAKYRPDPEELRTMCYLAIAAGSTALGFYSWDDGDVPGGPMDTSKMPDQIAAYRRLFKEFKELEPALTTANVGIPEIVPREPRGFFPCVKKGRDKRIYLFVASDLYRSATRTLVIPSAAGRTAKLLFAPWREGKLAAKPSLVFNAKGAAEVALPPVSSAVYVFEDNNDGRGK